jgi:hypothetical protein
MAGALAMDAKAAASTYEPAKALYEMLAGEWRNSYHHAIWRDDTALAPAAPFQ